MPRVTLQEFFKELNIDVSDTPFCYLRSTIYNTHTLNLTDDQKEARLQLLFDFDKFNGTNINERFY